MLISIANKEVLVNKFVKYGTFFITKHLRILNLLVYIVYLLERDGICSVS